MALMEKAYSLVIAGWDKLYQTGILKQHRLPVPVISIGNLTTGGTGKTPLVISLAQYLEAKDRKVVVLSRGYKARKKTNFHLADHPDYGDEAFLIQTHIKGSVFVGSNRVFTGTKAIQETNANVILLDDGFQHRRLYRDLNIVLVDGTIGFGNGHMLPAGPLREPISALHRANWVILTKQIENQQKMWTLLKSLRLKHPVQMATCPFTLAPIDTLQGHSVILVSGLAQPLAFEQSVKAQFMCLILEHKIFADHHTYTTQDWQHLQTFLETHPEATLLTTEKDWVKLKYLVPDSFLDRIAVLQLMPHCNWQPIVAGLLHV